ncbi:hypothetical protein D9M71_490170 [compost metagenome]
MTQVSLTDQGREMVSKVQEATSDIFNGSFTGLTEAQINKLNATLAKIFNNLPQA